MRHNAREITYHVFESWNYKIADQFSLNCLTRWTIL